MAELIAPQTAAAQSGNIVIAAGGSVTLTLKGPVGQNQNVPQLSWCI